MATSDPRILSARARLAANLSQLQERVTRAKRLVSPSTYLESPWLKVGGGIALGYVLGRIRLRSPQPHQLAAATVTAAPPSRGLVHAAIRATVTSIVGAMLERAVAKAMHGTTPDERE